ncbi:MAG: hypothetical protein LBB22_00905 [Treponema sp.]|jgi:hypothetical protein|nr:hypothetical protein [Treponema sp.]
MNEAGTLSISGAEMPFAHNLNFMLISAMTEDGKYGTAKVYVIQSNEKHPYTVRMENHVPIKVEPPSVVKGGSASCTVRGSSEGHYWTIDEPHVEGTTISESGILTVAESESAETILVRAIQYSDNDTGYYGTVIVTVTGALNDEADED